MEKPFFGFFLIMTTIAYFIIKDSFDVFICVN